MCECLCAFAHMYSRHWECEFSLSLSRAKCLSVQVRERGGRQSGAVGGGGGVQGMGLAYLCNKLGLDVSGHFYKC